MKKTVLYTLGLFALSLMLVDCADNIDNNNEVTLNLPEEVADYISAHDKAFTLKLPTKEQLESVVPGIEINPCHIDCDPNLSASQGIVSNELATLGRVLFYDGNLSKNNVTACASCHKQEKAFSDDVALSLGFGGASTKRNSMALNNVFTNNNFFWDGRRNELFELVQDPVSDHIEMGLESFDVLESKLSSVDHYGPLFTAAFGSPEIQSNKIAEALANFVASISSTESLFDREIDNDFANYSELEKLGMGLFFSERTQCSTCHSGPNFDAAEDPGNEYSGSNGTANIGLDLQYDDDGRGFGLFKIPSLRNIALTSPYMHDGRFSTIKEVLTHYNEDIKPHFNLDDKLFENGGPKRLQLTSLELDAMEAFLRTLTDESMVNNPIYANPFER